MSDDERFHASLLVLNRLIRGGGFPGETATLSGWLLADSGTGIAALNLAFVELPAEAARALQRVEDWFVGRSKGFRVILRDPTDDAVLASATARGYAVARSQPVMVARLPLAAFALPGGVRITTVKTPQDIRDYLSVRGIQANRPPEETEGEFIAAVIATGRFAYFVAYDRDRAVATASSAFADGIVHVSNVWVAEDARRRGCGATMTALAAAAFPGAEWASLEASAMGEPVYRRMGFEERYRYVQLTPPAAS